MTPPQATTTAARDQFAHQAPYLPGTFWLVCGIAYRIDPWGRPRSIVTDAPLQLAWWDRPDPPAVHRLCLVLDGRP